MLARLAKLLCQWRPLAARKVSRPSPPEQLLAALRKEHEETRSEAHREVGEVLSETERATLSVGRDLDRVVTAAQAFIADIKQRLGALEDAGDDSVSATLAQQCGLVTSFLDELRRSVQVQREASERTLATSQKVVQAAASVSQVASAARILCLNTMIEAGRLGDQGHAMIVIADQMRSLSDQIGTTNEEITRSMEALLPTLEQVSQSTAAVDERSGEFASEFQKQAERASSLASSLRETVHGVLDDGDDKLDTILGCSRNALTSLQTQDVVSQRLRRVLQLLDNSGTHLEKESEGDGETPPDTASRALPDVYLSESMGGESQRKLDAGEMLMF